MDYQLSVEADKVVTKRALNFLYVESAVPVRLDLELLLRKRFDSATIERLFPSSENVLSSLPDWQRYDLIIVATEQVATNFVWLSALQKSRFSLPVIIVLNDDAELRDKALWAGADLALPLQITGSEFAKQLDNLIEVNQRLKQYPVHLAQWHFQEVLHNSENSIVFLAKSQQHHLAVIKRFKFDVSGITTSDFSSFLQDAKLLTALKYSGLTHIIDVGVSCNAVMLIMEYVAGQTLKETLVHRADLALPTLVAWFKQITEALGVIHSLGLIHRDLKASNIVMRDNTTPVLLDYGIESSLMLSSGFLSEHEIYCTPFYVSPERVVGEPASVQSDLYALGILFYEMLVGDKPYRGTNLAEVLQQQLFEPLPQLPHGLSSYQPLLEQLLAKLPEQRPESAQAVLAWFKQNNL